MILPFSTLATAVAYAKTVLDTEPEEKVSGVVMCAKNTDLGWDNIVVLEVSELAPPSWYMLTRGLSRGLTR